MTVKIINNYFTYIRSVCFIKYWDELLFCLAHIFTVINCKIPLCSFNNTFNSWVTNSTITTFVEPLPPPPRPDPRLAPPPPRPRLFQFYNIYRFTSTRPPTNYSLDYNFTIASILGSHPPEHPPHFFNFTINSILGSHPPDPPPVRPPSSRFPRLFLFLQQL